MASTTISIPRGDEKVFTFTLYVVENNTKRVLTAGELAGMTFRFTAKRRLTDADSVALVQLSSAGGSPGIVINTSTSKATVTIPKAVTESVKPGGEPFFYDLRMFDSSGRPHTFVSDKLEVVPNVTRTVPA